MQDKHNEKYFERIITAALYKLANPPLATLFVSKNQMTENTSLTCSSNLPATAKKTSRFVLPSAAMVSATEP